MLKKGDVLGNRYEIIEKIGTGGMADVYKGKDHKLNRHVAIKVLKAEYSSNKNFVSKFKVEAQSAAGLMHQNIVNVYDVGEENGTYFFVMELVEGITLKSYIEKKIRLSIKEALSIAIQVANGIEAAHNNGIIHRDIKPQNIIISREGKVKVADFGIARAASSDTITSHAMGSVHYTSPEQARGGYSDAKSDIYSIGITIFEMVTGRVPFDGETTVSIAIKHIQEEMPSPRLYVPDIPISVEKIILKCTQKNPDRRYYNMAELIKDLKQALITPDDDFVEIHDARSNAGTKVISDGDVRKANGALNNQAPVRTGASQMDANIMNASQVVNQYPNKEGNRGFSPYDFDDDDEYDFEDGRLNSIPTPQRNQSNQISPSNQYEEIDREIEREKERERARIQREKEREREEYERKQQRKNAKHQKSNRNYESSRSNSRDDIDDVDPKMEKVMTTLLIVAAIVVAIVAIFAVGNVVGLFGKKSANKATVKEGYTLVPSVVGLDINAATKALDEAGLKAKASYGESTEYDRDYIISQDLEEGEEVEKGTVLTLVISSGKVGFPSIEMGIEGETSSEEGEDGGNVKGSTVPDVVGKTEAEARAFIEAEGFVMVKELKASDSVEKGIVVSQSPLGATRAAQGSEITVYISDGKDVSEVVVPDLVGKNQEEAKVLLEEAKLKYNTISEEANEAVAAGSVISQTVAAGTTVEEGTVVDFTVSKGPTGYTCSFSIQAPADYLEGTEAIVVLTDAVGSQLESVSTSTFPYSLVKKDIVGATSGIITVTYQKIDGTWDTTAPVAVAFTQD